MDVQPVEIVTGQVAGGAPLTSVLPWVMTGVGAALVAGVLLQTMWNWYRRLPERERAFLLLSLRLRLGRRERAAMRRMAAAINVAPVALLVSETAFRRAREATRDDGVPFRRAAAHVEARVFGLPRAARRPGLPA